MTLIERTDRLLSRYAENIIQWGSIKSWIWGEQPFCIECLTQHKKMQNALNSSLSHLKIDLLIMNATEEECETSSCGYIIECKEWIKNNDLQKEWAKAYREYRMDGIYHEEEEDKYFYINL